MGYWTTKSGNRHNVNIENDLIKAMQKAGARFCWMNDTPGIADENNETFYETKRDNDDTTGDTTNNTTDASTDTDESRRALRQGITVVTESGEQVTGYVAYWVRNYNNETPGTDIQNWFILQPGTSPTPYIIKRRDVVITDL